MFYKKTGKPEVGEIVLCTVKKIVMHSVFVVIDEYERLEGMVHISEIAPGRIRNLRDYVKEGKRIVCKVLDINRNTGNIDLSLRRVGTSFMVQKLNEIKQEDKAEKLLESVGIPLKYDLKKMYEEFGYKAVKEYGSLYDFFQAIVAEGEKPIKDLDINPKIAKPLLEIVKERIKPATSTLLGELKLSSYKPSGVEDIKKILLDIEKKGISVTYLGAPKYKVEITSQDRKKSGDILKKAMENALASIEKLKGSGEYTKIA